MVNFVPHRFPFVVHVDLDEYIIPRQYVDTSLASLIRRWGGLIKYCTPMTNVAECSYKPLNDMHYC